MFSDAGARPLVRPVFNVAQVGRQTKVSRPPLDLVSGPPERVPKTKRPAFVTPIALDYHPAPVNLEAQLYSKLKLSRVKRSRGLAVVAAIAGSLSETSDIVDKRRGRTFVETIEEVETLGN